MGTFGDTATGGEDYDSTNEDEFKPYNEAD